MEEYVAIDQKTLSNLQYYMPENSTLRQLADVFSLFADSTRLKILSALALSEMCVNDLSTYLNINQTTISHQLRFLKNFNAVIDKRKGKYILYSLGNDFVQSIMLDGVDFILK
jgi:ArsR family transcriptional regulator